MNEVLERMVAFREALSRFSEVLGTSATRQQTAEQNLAPFWDDDFARQFAGLYGDLDRPVLEFRRQLDQELLPFIDGKIHEIRGYLGNG